MSTHYHQYQSRVFLPHIFSRSEKLKDAIEKRNGGDLGALMLRLESIELDWFEDLSILEDYLLSQDPNSPPRLPSRRSKDPKERYISGWAHFQKETRNSETEFMAFDQCRHAWDSLVEDFPFAFNW